MQRVGKQPEMPGKAHFGSVICTAGDCSLRWRRKEVGAWNRKPGVKES